MSALMRHPKIASHPAAAACGLSCDGAALADGPARDALREAMQQLSQAEQADSTGQASAMCQALTETARALAGLHAYGPAESYLAQAQRWALMMGGHDLRADLACAMAEVATNAADLAEAQGQRERSRAARERARDHAFEAARLASLTTDPNWEVRVLLRASDVLDRCGDHDDAVQLQQRALVLMGLGQADLPPGDPLAAGRIGDPAPLTGPGVLM
jgi:hypothetical protein